MPLKPIEMFVHGSFENVSLSANDLALLKTKFGDKEALDWIEKLSEYIARFPKKAAHYVNHRAVIYSWARHEGNRGVEALKDDPVQGSHRCVSCAEPHDWVSADPHDDASFELSCPDYRSALKKGRKKT